MNETIVILNKILQNIELDGVKKVVRITHYHADSSTCQKRKSQNDDKKNIFLDEFYKYSLEDFSLDGIGITVYSENILAHDHSPIHMPA